MVLADAFEAEDVVQRVFLALLERGTDGLQSIDHYVWRAVRNECLGVLRRRRRHHAAAETRLLETLEATDESSEERMAIDRALRALPRAQREVVHLKVFEGLTLQEIAEVTGRRLNTVASRHRYAMRKLRLALGARTSP